MTRHAESQESAEWDEGCFPFSIPPASLVPEEYVSAYETFQRGMCRRLKTLSFRFRFDETGRLQRQQVPGPNATAFWPTEQYYYSQIARQLQMYGLGELPKFGAAPLSAAREIEQSTRARITQFLSRLMRAPQEFDPQNAVHIQSQFAFLSRWIKERLADGSLLPALQAAHEMLTALQDEPNDAAADPE